jgi:hypothetical protein
MPVAVEFLPVGDSDGDAILIQYGDSTGYRLNLDRVAGSSRGVRVGNHRSATTR